MALQTLSNTISKPIINNQIKIICVNDRHAFITHDNEQFIITLDKNYLHYKNASNKLSSFYNENGIRKITDINDVIREIDNLYALSGWIDRVYESCY